MHPMQAPGHMNPDSQLTLPCMQALMCTCTPNHACAYWQSAEASTHAVQALVLCTSREIALQAAETVDNLAQACGRAAVRAGVFIGGLPMSEDMKLLRRRAPDYTELASAIAADA